MRLSPTVWARRTTASGRKIPPKTDEVYPKAIYEFVRAMVIDPSLGGTQDGKKISDSITKIYINYHGSDEGLEELKTQAKASPLPPAGFAHRIRHRGRQSQAEGIRIEVPATGHVAGNQEPACQSAG